MMWWQWPDVSGAALSRLTVLAPWIWNIFCSYHLFLVRTGPGLNWCVAVPPWLVCNFYDPHGNGGSAVEVERPAHTFLVEWLGFQDRYSHIKAQLRAEAVVSKGGSNVWVVRYLLLCLGRKNLLNRIFSVGITHPEALLRLCHESWLKAALSQWGAAGSTPFLRKKFLTVEMVLLKHPLDLPIPPAILKQSHQSCSHC